MRSWRVCGGIVAWMVVGCARGGGSDPEAGAVVEQPVAAPLGRPAHFLEPVGGSLGSPVVAARLEGRRVVFAADADQSSIVAFDPEGRSLLAATRVDGVPAQLLVGRDGRLYASLREGNAVAVLEATGRGGGLVVRARLATETEPVGLGLADDGATLLVASGFGHTLEGFSLVTAARPRLYAVPLAREPRAVTLSEDGRTAYVSHAMGSLLSSVDLTSPEHAVRRIPLGGSDTVPALPESVLECLPPKERVDRAHAHITARPGVQGFALARLGEHIYAPQVLARAGNPQVHTDGYGHSVGDLPSHIFSVAVVDDGTLAPTPGSVHLMAEPVAHQAHRWNECRLPRGAAIDAARGSLFVACVDMDSVVELDPRAADPAHAEKRRFDVSQGPVGVAVDADEQEAYVWSQFSRTLDVLPLGDPKATYARDRPYKRLRIEAPRDDDSDDPRRSIGRALFHTSGDGRIAKDGRACASCHPDGRDDGLTWSTPEGPRQPPMLAGRLAGTAPYSWAGSHRTIEEHLVQTFTNLHGTGLDAAELDALVGYVTTLRGPVRTPRPADARERRGHELFASADVGCTNCHHESSALTDGSLHDVSSRAPGDDVSQFDTPSLRFVGGTAPYFHDGRYATLRQLLVATDGTMGTAGHLPEADLDALEAYLKTL